MEYKCPGCGKAFEITESGIYKCDQCGDLFQFIAEATPSPSPVLDKFQHSQCPMCKGVIPPDVKKCQHCGSWIGEKPPSVLVYVLLWLFIPTAILGVPLLYAGKKITAAFVPLLSVVFLFVLGYSENHKHDPAINYSVLFVLIIVFLCLFRNGYYHIQESQL